MNVRLSSPANLALVRCLKLRAASPAAVSSARHRESASPESIEEASDKLGVHPDLLGWFWHELTARLPVKCQWVVWGAPVLIHPASGVIFGFAGGTHTYALRLPPKERDAALTAGCRRVWEYRACPELNMTASTLSLDEIGKEWVFGQFQPREKEWCLAAFRFADESTEVPPGPQAAEPPG